MDAFKKFFENVSSKWKASSRGLKTGIIVFASGVLIALLFLIIFNNKPKYEPLFLNMPPEDMAKVVDILKQDKVNYKINGDSILVPADKVEELRLTVAGSGNLPSNGKGFELFDQNKFGMTDTETRIQYQRALETELQRTIKGFNEVDQAVVHLVMPEPSVFVRDQQPASASVTLKLKNKMKLSPDQVKAIVALVSASVPNLSKENVVVVDNNYNYLTEDLYSEDASATPNLANRDEAKKQFEQNLETDLKKSLDAVFGQDKSKVSVNADLDFDAKQTTSIHYDKDKIIKNQNTIKETVTNTGSNQSGSPIDNQTSAVIDNGSTGNTQKNHEEETTNYDVGQVEEKTIRAPGQVKRISTSVVIDGTLPDDVKQSVTNMVMATTGYVNDATRQDLISVEGMPFDTSIKKQAEQDLKEMQDAQKAKERKKKLYTYVLYPAIGVALLIALIIIAKKRAAAARKKAEGVDVLVGQQPPVNEVIKVPPLDLDEDNEKPDLVEELKKYANKKPDQVLEIIKSWLAEDER